MSVAVVRPFALITLALFSSLTVAQTAPRILITKPVDENQLTVLKGNTHPLARAEFDRGAAPADLPMNRMLLVLKRSDEQESALRSLIDNQQDKASPNYHKWLTPEQFGKQFGPSDQDIAQVTSWLQSHGFQIAQVSKGRTVIEFSGTAAQVQEALHTSIHRYAVNGEEHWANSNDPQIPAALMPVVSGVLTLHNFLKKPQIHILNQQIAAEYVPGEKPQFTSPSGLHALTPADYSTIYNINPIYQSVGTGFNGRIAVVGRSNLFNSGQDITDFNGVFGTGATAPQILLNGPDPGDLGGGEEVEATLDTTWAGAIARNSSLVTIVVSASTNTTDGVDLSELYIIDNNVADVMTESFGTCEAGSTDALAISSLAEQAAAQGITYIVSTGDSGAEGCDDANSESVARGPLSVNVLASTPFNVAVGGTMFNEDGQDSRYWSSSNAQGTLESALSYIPENAWNESCSAALCGQNANILAGGGGASILVAKPSWQSGVTGILNDGVRDVPDVSLTAAGHDPYLLCLEGSCAIYPQRTTISFLAVSGTSASAPSFAGIMELVDQSKTSGGAIAGRQGQAGYVLYRLAAAEDFTQCTASSPTSTCVFNDIVVGNDAVPGEAGYGTSSASYQSGPGYDLATGLGSINVSNLVNNWNSVTFNSTTTTLSFTPANNIPHGSSVKINVVVSSKAGGTPTGNVTLVGYTGPGFEMPVNSGLYSLTGGSVSSTTSSLPGGLIEIVARYSGDATFGSSTSAFSSPLTVNPEPSTTTLAIASGFNQQGNPIPFTGGPYGTFTYLRADVKGKSGVGTPTGSITFTDTNPGQSLPTLFLNSQGNTATPNGFFTFIPGAHSVAAVYSSDFSFMTSTSPSNSFTITQAATTTTVATSPSAQGATFNVTVNTTSGGNSPTGTVTFYSGSNSLGNVPVSGGTNSGSGMAQATATFNDTQLANGQYTVTATYSGDSNYTGSTSSPLAINVVPDFSLNESVNSITISSPGQSGTLLLAVNYNDGFSGTVNFSCSGLPIGASCSAPALTATGTSLLTVTTKAPGSAAIRAAAAPASTLWTTAFGACFVGIFLVSGRSRSDRSNTLFSLVAVAFLALGIGCGGGSSSSPSPPAQVSAGTPMGTYTVTVTATSGTLNHAISLTLTVQ